MLRSTYPAPATLGMELRRKRGVLSTDGLVPLIYSSLPNAAVREGHEFISAWQTCPHDNVRMRFIYGQANCNVYTSKPTHVGVSQEPLGDQILQGDSRWNRQALGLQTVGIGLCCDDDLACVNMTRMPTGGDKITQAHRHNGDREHRYDCQNPVHITS